MSEQPQTRSGGLSRKAEVRPDGGWRDPDEDESEADDSRDDETSPNRDRQPRQGDQPPRDQRRGQNQPQQSNQQPQNQRRGQNQPRQGNQQPPRRQQSQRGPGGGSDGFSRRQMLIGGGGAAVAAVGGWFVFLRDSGGGPEGVVKSYYSAGSNGNFEQAASLVHEDSPSRDSLTNFEGTNPNEIDISVDSVESLNESEAGFSYNATNYVTVQEFEILDVTTTISNSGTTTGQQGSETTTLTWVVAKNTDGEWKLWQ